MVTAWKPQLRTSACTTIRARPCPPRTQQCAPPPHMPQQKQLLSSAINKLDSLFCTVLAAVLLGTRLESSIETNSASACCAKLKATPDATSPDRPLKPFQIHLMRSLMRWRAPGAATTAHRARLPVRQLARRWPARVVPHTAR